MAESSPKQIAPYGLRIPAELKARIQAAAERNSRSLHAEILHTLEEKYPAEDELERLVRLLKQTKRMHLAAKTEQEREAYVKVMVRVWEELEAAANGRPIPIDAE